ncbi:MAG: hypothetical protein RBU45_04240 [Myxococcota bacterium]|jgi:hypothetical protein|nr:hypothetical protein [Myxococcota bacterium]
MPTYQEQQRQQVENRTNQQGDQVATARPTAVDQVKTYLESCPTAASTARYVKQLQAQGLLNEAGLAKVRDLIQHTCGNDYAKEVAFHLNNKSRQALPGDFEAMWEAHPHNYQEDPAENTSSDEVHEELGWKAGTYENTCAMRLSVMFNKLGGEYKIDRTKVEKAGIPKHRAFYSKATNTYLLLSAKEMWTYVSYWFGKAH